MDDATAKTNLTAACILRLPQATARGRIGLTFHRMYATVVAITSRIAVVAADENSPRTM